MTFKDNWEKTHTHTIVDKSIIEEMIAISLPHCTLQSYEIISGGCANLNMKVYLDKAVDPLILRLYVRDPKAAYREKKIADLLKDVVPIPKVIALGSVSSYPYTIAEYIPGITLRDLLLRHEGEDYEGVMIEAGQMLGTLHQYSFPQMGFFDEDLKIVQELSQADCLIFLKESLHHPTVKEVIDPPSIKKIETIIERYGHHFPNDPQGTLVHGDYDPANILVDKVNGRWKITAILDWEFSFSGPWLCDVSNMLRYAHHMPPLFQNAFIRGITEGGLSLPEHWQITIRLSNLLALLDCLVRCPPKERPNQCADICQLINHIICEFEEGVYS